MSEQDHEGDGSILDDGGIDTEERAGRSQGIDPHAEPDEDTKQDIEEERERRLDPENRPDGAEVDNTSRTFDTERGMFTDSEGYDESDPQFASEEAEEAEGAGDAADESGSDPEPDDAPEDQRAQEQDEQRADEDR